MKKVRYLYRLAQFRMPARQSNQPSGRVCLYPDLPRLHADKFYAGVKTKRGPKCKSFADVLQCPKKQVSNPYRSYTVRYKLRVLSYWIAAEKPCGPTRVQEPTREEVAFWFKVPAGNLTRWRKEEEQGKFIAQRADQRRAGGGGRGRQ